MAVDLDSPTTRLATAVATSAWALIDPARPTRRGRIAYWGVTAGVSAAGAWWASGQPSEGEEPAEPRTRVLIAAATGLGVIATMRASVATDRRWHAWLARRGVAHPRAVTAALSLGAYAAGEVLERRTRAQAA